MKYLHGRKLFGMFFQLGFERLLNLHEEIYNFFRPLISMKGARKLKGASKLKETGKATDGLVRSLRTMEEAKSRVHIKTLT